MVAGCDAIRGPGGVNKTNIRFNSIICIFRDSFYHEKLYCDNPVMVNTHIA